MNFIERAHTTVQKGVPVIRLRPKTKIAMDMNWPALATTDPAVIERWGQETPDANCAAVAIAKEGGTWFLEVDDPSVIPRIESETGQKIPKTYRVRSRPGRGHLYFRHTQESLALGNLSQGFVKNADFSARLGNQYVVSANSVHPISGLPYEVLSTADIIDAPVWLVDWLKSQRVTPEAKLTAPEAKIGKIQHGSIHGYMLHEAGKLRNNGLTPDEIEPILLRMVHDNCEPPINEDKVRAMAQSVGKYEPENTIILFDGKVAGTPLVTLVEPEEMEEQPVFVVPPYPKFPAWVFEGCSIYEGLVRPYCSQNSRYEEFMFIPAMTLMLNYLGTKVRIEYKDIIPSLYTVLIGKKGRVIKSSSVKDAMKYFQYMGLLEQGGPTIRNAEGKIVVFTAGSPEGLGIEAQRINARNFVLFYDELSALTNKAGIDSSNLIPNLLTMYEGDKFSNLIKSKKETYSLDPGTYCTSLIACCTDKNFKTLWSKMSGSTSGLNDRFFFLYQPEDFKPVIPPISVNCQDGALVTRQRIDAAVKQGVYRITDSSPLAKRMVGSDSLENRQEIRAEKFALFFAVDMGFDEITEECIERGLALVEYERAVKRKLRPSEAVNKEAALQNEIVDFLLGYPGGVVAEREIIRHLHPERYGTSLWGVSFTGLIKSGQIKLSGTGKKSDPKMVVLLRAPEESDE